MPEMSAENQEFLTQLNSKIAENIANEQFGVTELADAMNMSRSNLLRKVKKAANVSVSQLISQVRLTRGMELLRTGTFNVSEVATQVGFSSTSYFIKCFREYYGYPPGEVGKRAQESTPDPVMPFPPEKNNTRWIMVGAAAAVLLVATWFVYTRWSSESDSSLEKSIAVLPFKNDSNDSTNVYLINGLMESTLNNLMKIRNLKVISRTSAEKYRSNAKTIPEMAKELNANYFVEGSGQKIGDRIVLNVQLVDATDRHLWSRQYRREAKDVFALQQEIAKDIVEEIQVLITADEKARIEKVPTENAEAYDAFLKGVDLLNKSGDANLQKSIDHFNEAIANDKTFSLAYACAGMACYYLDLYKAEQPHVEQLRNYSDNAMRYDPTLAEAFTSKAMYYLVRKEYSQALPYLEKALEYKPNSTQILGLLADFYGLQLPNTGKYLEYALRGLRLGAHAGDSMSISYFHLRLANALVQTGFVDQSLDHINRSLEYFPANAYARYVRAFVLYAKNGDLRNTRALLVKEFNKDTSRFDILQDIGKVSYYLGEYDTAYICYQRFNRYREAHKLNVYDHESMIIGKVYEKNGDLKKAKEFYDTYRRFVNNDQTVYRNLSLAFIYCQEGNREKALEHLRLFAREDNILYWLILFINKAPDMTPIERSPEFQKILQEIERKFWANHDKLRLTLEEKGVM